MDHQIQHVKNVQIAELLDNNNNYSNNEENHSIDLEECPPNHFTPAFLSRTPTFFFIKMVFELEDYYLAAQRKFQDRFHLNRESMLPTICAKKNNQRSITGNNISHPDNNERDPKFQHIPTEFVLSLSSSVLSTVVSLGISYNIWSILSSVIRVPPLHKEWDHRLSMLLSLLVLFGFMAFVCAAAVMILVRAPFTIMQKAMLIFWAILLLLRSANSTIDVFVTLVIALLMVWYTFGKEKPPNEVI